MLEWKENLSSSEWDGLLSTLHGHPLQSAKWGDARMHVDGIRDYRWAAFQSGKPLFLVRFEDRQLFRFMKLAWVPKGGTVLDKQNESFIRKEFLKELKKKGYDLCAASSCMPIKTDGRPRDFTIWLDLGIAKEQLWKNLDKQFRYDARRAEKEGVIVCQTKEKTDIEHSINYVILLAYARDSTYKVHPL